MTLFHPASGQVRAKGVTSCPNSILHPWLKQELSAILAALPAPVPEDDPTVIRDAWAEWYEGLSTPPTLPDDLPPLRMILVQDNLAGHKSHDFVQWCFSQGIALLYTPLGGSWLNMTESIQGIIQQRALNGQQPTNPQQIIECLESADGAFYVALRCSKVRLPDPFHLQRSHDRIFERSGGAHHSGPDR